jgi:glycosyltransferase involved in cell wall biosynthesis
LVALAIQSVLDQTFRDWELIVIDDGSTDHTAQVIEGFNDSRIEYVYQKNGGVSSARNRGIRLSQGPRVAFLDSDDRWHPEKLQNQLRVMRERPNYRAIYTNEVWIRRGRRVNQKRKHRKYSGWIYKRCLPLCIISPSSVLMDRCLLDERGLFDESFPVCEDYELWLRITCRHPVYFLDEALITKTGGHSDQLSRSRWGFDRYRIRALEKILLSESLTSLQRLWTAKEIIAKAGILSAGYRNRNKPEGAARYSALAQSTLAKMQDEGLETSLLKK